MNSYLESQALLCNASGCKSNGKLVCSSCKSVKYCGKDCQQRHWKSHKPNCRPMKTNVALNEEDQDEYVDILPLRTRVSLSTGKISGDEFGTIVAFNRGLGPYANPETRYDIKLVSQLMKNLEQDKDTDSCSTHSSIPELMSIH